MDADSITVAVIISIPPTLVGIAALIASIKNGTRVTQLHTQINSRMDQLLKTEKGLSQATGKAEGIESERVRKLDA